MPAPIMSLSRRLAEHADKHPDVLALTRLGPDGDPASVLDYGGLWQRVGGLASRLVETGATGRPVLIPEHNGIDYVVGYLACIRSGAIAVTAHAPRANDRSGRLDSIIGDARPVCALASTNSIEKCLDIGSPLLRELAFHATDDPALDAEGDADLPEVDLDSIAMLQYTSGSTSSPRAVQVTHGNLIANLDVMSSLFYREGSVGTVCWLPLFHDMGLIGMVMTSLVSGITANLMAPEEFVMRPIRWLRAISKTRSEYSGGPNFSFSLCVERTSPEERAELDLSCWKIALNGAEAIHPSTIERFVEVFEPCGFDVSAMQPCYGLAESTLIVATRVPGSPLGFKHISSNALVDNRLVTCEAGSVDARRITTCGPPIPGHQLRILDETGVFTGSGGEVGEICVRGPSVTMGYRQGADADQDTFVPILGGEPGPWLRTGDLGGFLDGELVVAGRLKDLIIVGGSNHHPQDLERSAEQAHDDIASGGCAAFAVQGDSPHEAEQVVLLVELGRERTRALRKDPDGLDSILSEITRKVRAAISSEHSVALSQCVILKSGGIPRTTSGKVRRAAAAAAWHRGELPLH
jgi:acyl-CoA synthetase (AMP-forming)/AMP-acid ligase II